jgi:hypothetical protein
MQADAWPCFHSRHCCPHFLGFLLLLLLPDGLEDEPAGREEDLADDASARDEDDEDDFAPNLPTSQFAYQVFAF